MPKRKLPNKNVKISSGLYVHGGTGDVVVTYGQGGWFKKKIGNVKGTKAFKALGDTYGTKEGARVRRNFARAIDRSLGK